MKREFRKILYPIIRDEASVAAVTHLNILTLFNYFKSKDRLYTSAVEAASIYIKYQNSNAYNIFIKKYTEALREENPIETNVYLKSYFAIGQFDFYGITDYFQCPLSRSRALFEIYLMNGFKIGEFYENSFVIGSTLDVSCSYIETDASYKKVKRTPTSLLLHPGFFYFSNKEKNIAEESYTILHNQTLIRNICKPKQIFNYIKWNEFFILKKSR